MGVRFLLAVSAMVLVAGMLLEFGASQSSANARPVVSARLTAVDATVGGTAVHVVIKAKCETGWDNNTFAQRLMVREDLTGTQIVAFTNFAGADAGWACDGQDHVMDFALTADGPWQSGALRADFYATVTDGTNTSVDFARKSAHIR